MTGQYRMDRETTRPCKTGSLPFLEELQLRNFKNGDEVLHTMTSQSFTLEYLIKNGFTTPIVVHNSEGLELKIPHVNEWNDFKPLIGGDTKVEVIDVLYQGQSTMNFGDFIDHMNNPQREKILNLLSLECSKNSLGDMIIPPYVVRKLDWVLNYWPQDEEDRRPLLQKYLLISQKNSYTDFHIDFSGTSVWYHVKKGAKTFYIIPPTSANTSLYWSWDHSEKKLFTFFGDQVDECYKCTLKAGTTLFLPGGWIHAVYTTEDSIVYGGNFLHSLHIAEQIMTYEMEIKYKTPKNYLVPYYRDIHWYTAQNLLQELKWCNQNKSVPYNYVFNGLKILARKLKYWLRERGFRLKHNDAKIFFQEIEKQIKAAKKLVLYQDPPPQHQLQPRRASTRKRRTPFHEGFVDVQLFRKHAFRNPPKSNAPKNDSDSNADQLVPNYDEKIIIKKTDTDLPSTSGGPKSKKCRRSRRSRSRRASKTLSLEIDKQNEADAEVMVSQDPPAQQQQPRRASSRKHKPPLREGFVDIEIFRKHAFRNPPKSNAPKNDSDSNADQLVPNYDEKIIIKKTDTDLPSTSGGPKSKKCRRRSRSRSRRASKTLPIEIDKQNEADAEVMVSQDPPPQLQQPRRASSRKRKPPLREGFVDIELFRKHAFRKSEEK